MLDFMENVQNAFYEASHWNLDNSYGALNATARGTSHTSFHLDLMLIVYCSTARFPDTKGTETADIIPCRSEFRDIVYPRKCRRRRWLRVLPVLIAAIEEEI